MQKVISLIIYPSSNMAFDYDKGFVEVEHPAINKLLSEGYIVKDTYSSTVTLGSAGALVITFVLLK